MVATNQNPYNNNYASIIAVDGVCAVVAIIFTGLRIYARRLNSGKPRLDDWLLVAGVVAFVTSLAFDIAAWVQRDRLGVTSGNPGHLMEVVDIMFYLAAEILVRGAYTAFYLRIVPRELDLMLYRYSLLVIYGIYAMFQFAVAFIFLFQCGVPHETVEASAKCIDPTILSSIFHAVYYFDCIFDWVMVLIPMRVVWSNTHSTKIRTGALAVLSLGCCAGGLAIGIIQLSREQDDYTEANGEDLRLSIKIDILAACEVMVAIVCLSLATLRPLLRQWFENDGEKAPAPSEAWILTPSPTSPAFTMTDYPYGRRESVANCLGLVAEKDAELTSKKGVTIHTTEIY